MDVELPLNIDLAIFRTFPIKHFIEQRLRLPSKWVCVQGQM